MSLLNTNVTTVALPQYMSVADAAARLGASLIDVLDLVDSGHVAAVTYGTQVLVSQGAVETIVANAEGAVTEARRVLGLGF